MFPRWQPKYFIFLGDGNVQDKKKGETILCTFLRVKKALQKEKTHAVFSTNSTALLRFRQIP